MTKIGLSIILCILAFTSNNFAQVCGSGFYTITLNTKETVNYDLFSVTPKESDYSEEKFQIELGKIFFPDEEKSIWFWNSMPQIKNKVAEQFLINYNPQNFAAVYDNLPTSGTSENRIINIKTAEAYSAPFLMKITSTNFQTAYYLGSFLGGCKTKKKISLEKTKQ